MKKSWKWFWIVCGALFVIGIVLCISAIIFGFQWGDGLHMIWEHGSIRIPLLQGPFSRSFQFIW